MSGARMSKPVSSTLASLRTAVERLEQSHPERLSARVALGHAEVDGALKGGLALGAMHEVFADKGHGAAATGFVLAMAARSVTVWM